MKYDKINGLEKNISKLIMGNDNQTDFEEASRLWDHWIDVGGNAFDNAHIYGGGSMEALLGKWHKSRKNLNRYDKFNSRFYENVQKGFLLIANKNKKKYKIINSNLDIKFNQKKIIQTVDKLL